MKDMENRVHDAMYRQIQTRGYAAPVDVLMDIGVLDKKKYEDWCAGRIPYLEAVCNANLHKLSEIMKEIRRCGAQNGWKSSITSYPTYHELSAFHLENCFHNIYGEYSRAGWLPGNGSGCCQTGYG